MYLTIYLIGIVVAFYLIGKKLAEKEDDIEFSGDIVAYVFAIFSWAAVFAFLLASICKRIENKKDDRT